MKKYICLASHVTINQVIGGNLKSTTVCRNEEVELVSDATVEKLVQRKVLKLVEEQKESAKSAKSSPNTDKNNVS